LESIADNSKQMHTAICIHKKTFRWCNLCHMNFDNGNFEEYLYLLQEIAVLKNLIADQEERIRSFDQRLGIHWKIIEKQVGLVDLNTHSDDI